MAKRKRPLIGAHVSVAGGLHKGLDKALSIGAETIQIFGGPPVQWNSRSHDSESIEKFLLKHRESGLGPVFIHAIYLVNLASPNDTIRQKSVKSLADHLLLAQKIGAAGLVFHPGSSRGLPRDKALKLLVNGIKKIVRMVPGKTKLVLENTAGSGQSIGAAIGEIGLILKESGSRRLAVCLDTAHALQSGILDLSSGETVGEFLDTWNNQ
ncbi:MAG: deoxyribonuclease IV, partial [bacterium]|nr:deoxyribonuclease IV [bacterium]